MSRYQDYVFKNGQFVGDFEKMYREASEVPWHQDATAYMVFSDIDVGILNHFPFERFCEVGCGLGYFTRRVRSEMRFAAAPQCLGVDISVAAIEKAQELHSGVGLNFAICDVLRDEDCERIVQTYGTFDMILVKELMWYVVPQREIFYTNLLRILSENGYILLSQSFPEVKNYFGADVFPGVPAMIEFFGRKLQFKYQCVERDSISNGRELVHYLGQKVV